MNKKIKILLIIFIVVIVVIGVILVCFKKFRLVTNDESHFNPGDVKMDELDINFLKLENNKSNIIYSPLSIKYALSMLKEGADGGTLEELDKVLVDNELTKYENIDKVLSFANGLFVRDTYKEYIKENYINILKDEYEAEVVYDKFENAKNVNSWIEDKTLGIIKNLINSDVVQNPDLKIMLINALAIDMEWKYKFDDSDTFGSTFYKDDNSKMEATMMHKTANNNEVLYYKDSNVTAISMDLDEYKDTNLEFMLIMPDSNLNNYINKVTVNDIGNISSKLKGVGKNQELHLSIPKFSYDYSLKLVDDLNVLGINEVFTPSANLTKIGDNGIYVSNALHKANIDFTEKGIKAAAVTVIMMKDSMALVDEVEIINIDINKPFMYIIRDKKDGTIWFVGSVYEPNLWDDDKSNYGYE